MAKGGVLGAEGLFFRLCRGPRLFGRRFDHRPTVDIPGWSLYDCHLNRLNLILCHLLSPRPDFLYGFFGCSLPVPGAGLLGSAGAGVGGVLTCDPFS